MLQYLNHCSRQRTAWLLLSLTAIVLELTALWFQHGMGLSPCVLCIYERCALYGVLIAGVVGAIAPKSPLRFIAIIIWLYSAGKGIALSLQHTMLLVKPPLFSRCDFAVDFPSWLPLDSWLPQVFKATGDCSAHQWQWLGLEMPEWLLGIFIAYLLAALLVLVVQPLRRKRQRANLFR